MSCMLDDALLCLNNTLLCGAFFCAEAEGALELTILGHFRHCGRGRAGDGVRWCKRALIRVDGAWKPAEAFAPPHSTPRPPPTTMSKVA
jgi:hypothetical protein